MSVSSMLESIRSRESPLKHIRMIPPSSCSREIERAACAMAFEASSVMSTWRVISRNKHQTFSPKLHRVNTISFRFL